MKASSRNMFATNLSDYHFVFILVFKRNKGK